MFNKSLLVTHVELLRDPPTDNQLFYSERESGYGADTVRKLIEALIKRTNRDPPCRQVTVVRLGEGKRFDSLFAEWDLQVSRKHRRLDCNLSPLLGVSTFVRTQWDTVVSSEGRMFPKPGYDGLTKFVSSDKAWDFVEEKETQAHKILPYSYAVHFGGRLFTKLLGVEELFDIASIYELDWRKREAHCILPRSALVPSG